MKTWTIRAALLVLTASLVPACGGGGGGGTGVGVANQIWEVVGGEGTTGAGGTGGITVLTTQIGGDVRVVASGTVNSRVVIPTAIPDLGGNPRTITGTVSLAVGTGLTQTVATILGDDGLTTATGLHVKPGATLNLEPNYDTNANAANNEAVQLQFIFGVLIEGTVNIANADSAAVGDSGDDDAGDLTIQASNVVATAASVFNFSAEVDGADADTVGGNGGAILFTAAGTLVMRGDVWSQGRAGSSGGSGGSVMLVSAQFGAFIEGTFFLDGGNGTVTGGGPGGQVIVSSIFGPICNDADISAGGGGGETAGGAGGTILLQNTASGAVLSSGDIYLAGGSGDTGPGGPGGVMLVQALSGGFRMTGTLTAPGGDSASSTGGPGGVLAATAVPGAPIGAGLSVIQPSALGVKRVAPGGRGITGGPGGVTQVTVISTGFATPDDAFTVVGLGRLRANGGAGETTGGAGGMLIMQVQPATDPTGNPFIGSVENQAAFEANGGAGDIDNGGNGGLFMVTGVPAAFAPTYDQSFVNSGAISASGGTGQDNGGIGGVFLIAHGVNLINRGALTLNGGDCDNAAGSGGAATGIELVAEKRVENTGAVTASGGANPSGTGGDALGIAVVAQYAVNRGNLTANGGDGDAQGGDAGEILVLSTAGSSINTGILTAEAGDGTVQGAPGSKAIDGIFIP